MGVNEAAYRVLKVSNRECTAIIGVRSTLRDYNKSKFRSKQWWLVSELTTAVVAYRADRQPGDKI